ncbi:MAG TPA: histidine phosphatase family protein [Aeromicrobium sp.]|nr:histidine phosphatase family protein [Aeromicrobium sp.]
MNRGDHRLVLVRHAKSDWSAGVPDVDRPLSARGRRQAPESGAWLATRVAIDRAVVSPAQRARSTWDLVAAEYESAPPATFDDDAYTFDGHALLAIIRHLNDDDQTVALVGHNPAMEELIHLLTGRWLPMPTACLAVIDLPGDWRDAAGEGGATVFAHGRPPTQP